MPTLTRLLPSSTKRFYSRLRAISVYISPEIYSQANIRDPSGGFKRRVLLLLKEGVMDSLRRHTSLLHAAGRAVAAWTGVQLGELPGKLECPPAPRGALVEDNGPRVDSVLQGVM